MQKRTCCITGREFLISEEEETLLRDFDLPLPKKAPIERWLEIIGRAMPFTFHREVCPVTNNPVLSRWTKRGAIVGVDPDWFWSDECDNTAAGQPYDFNRPFFEQFLEVAHRSYAPSINRINCEDSPYVNGSVGLKRCHLCFACRHLQDSIYCTLCDHSTDLLLCIACTNSELCYACIDCDRIYGSRFLQDCRNCRDCFWCLDCIGCSNCFGCVGLRQARDGHYIFNTKVSQQEWDEQVGAWDLGSLAAEAECNKKAEDFFRGKRDYNTNWHNERCSNSEHIWNSKNVSSSLHSTNCEDCKDLIFSSEARDCYSGVWLDSSERCYMLAGTFEAYDCCFCDGVIGNANNHTYGFCNYNGCEHVFGCFFLKRHSYCILNKEYKKKEYFDLLPRVIDHMKSTAEWGQWFPNELYGVAYCDSWAHFLLAELTDEEVRKRGLIVESEERERVIETGWEQPDNVRNFSKQMCDREFRCAKTGRPYGVGKKELSAFVKHKAPILPKHWAVMLTEMQRKSVDLRPILSAGG